MTLCQYPVEGRIGDRWRTLAWGLPDRLVVRARNTGQDDIAIAGARDAFQLIQVLIGDPGDLVVRLLGQRIVEVAGYLPAAEQVPATQIGIQTLRRLLEAHPGDRDVRNTLARALRVLADRTAAAIPKSCGRRSLPPCHGQRPPLCGE